MVELLEKYVLVISHAALLGADKMVSELLSFRLEANLKHCHFFWALQKVPEFRGFPGTWGVNLKGRAHIFTILSSHQVDQGILSKGSIAQLQWTKTSALYSRQRARVPAICQVHAL